MQRSPAAPTLQAGTLPTERKMVGFALASFPNLPPALHPPVHPWQPPLCSLQDPLPAAPVTPLGARPTWHCLMLSAGTAMFSANTTGPEGFQKPGVILS